MFMPPKNAPAIVFQRQEGPHLKPCEYCGGTPQEFFVLCDKCREWLSAPFTDTATNTVATIH